MQISNGDNACCLANVLLETSVDSFNKEPINRENTPRKWGPDSGATCHMIRSADMMHDVQPTNDKVRVEDHRTIDIVGYGTLSVVFPGNLTVKPLEVAYVPGLSSDLSSLMAARRREVDFRTEES